MGALNVFRFGVRFVRLRSHKSNTKNNYLQHFRAPVWVIRTYQIHLQIIASGPKPNTQFLSLLDTEKAASGSFNDWGYHPNRLYLPSRFDMTKICSKSCPMTRVSLQTAMLYCKVQRLQMRQTSALWEFLGWYLRVSQRPQTSSKRSNYSD